MHILVVTDQHPQSLGGVQVALRLQRKFLERLGHRMTIVAPRLHRPHGSHVDDIDLPSLPITKDREYGVSVPGRRTDRAVLAALRSRPSVDIVHIQGDFWGALIGYRIARQLRVPVVHTMHNNVDEGTRAVTAWAPFAFSMLNAWRRITLGRTSARQRGAWRYLASLAEHARLVTAPSAHFARELEAHGVAAHVEVTPNGVDDDLIAAAIERRGATNPASAQRSAEVRAAAEPTTGSIVTFVWLGRMSHEKRILEFLKAITLVDPEVRAVLRVELFGAGLLSDQVAAFIRENGLSGTVTQHGSVSHEQAIAAIAGADALVQTSVGFETQGLTVFEAAAVGTPSILCDPNIAADLSTQPSWLVPDTSIVALAKTLEAVAALFAVERQRVPSTRARTLMQSEQTVTMLSLYERVRAADVGFDGASLSQ